MAVQQLCSRPEPYSPHDFDGLQIHKRRGLRRQLDKTKVVRQRSLVNSFNHRRFDNPDSTISFLLRCHDARYGRYGLRRCRWFFRCYLGAPGLDAGKLTHILLYLLSAVDGTEVNTLGRRDHEIEGGTEKSRAVRRSSLSQRGHCAGVQDCCSQERMCPTSGYLLD